MGHLEYSRLRSALCAAFSFLVLAPCLPACFDHGPASPSDAETDSVAGGDADADADADADVDSDADADSDVDADVDADTDADVDADTDTDSDTDSDADSDTDQGTIRVQAQVGTVCDLANTIGVVTLSGFASAPYVDAWLQDRPHPWIGVPILENATCEHHKFVPGCTDGCQPGYICSNAGACVVEPRTIKDAALIVTTGSESQIFEADPTLGDIYGELDIGTASSSFGMLLKWSGVEVSLDQMPVASGNLAELLVTVEGVDSTPGALDVVWTPSAEGAFLRTKIPINHHAAGPTFTECITKDTTGAFHADADMINPLAVKTGLEFQGLEHAHTAAATTPAGCVEFRFGTWLYVNVSASTR